MYLIPWGAEKRMTGTKVYTLFSLRKKVPRKKETRKKGNPKKSNPEKGLIRKKVDRIKVTRKKRYPGKKSTAEMFAPPQSLYVLLMPKFNVRIQVVYGMLSWAVSLWLCMIFLGFREDSD